jgi:hypothetical protein
MKRSPGRDAWLNDYREALTQAAGIAYILGFSDHAKTLHELSCQAMGIAMPVYPEQTTNRRQKDIDTVPEMQYHKGNAANMPLERKQEVKKMKKYEFGFYAESGEFFEIREYGFDNGRKYYVAANSAEKAYSEFVGALDDEYCGEEMTVREIPAGHDMTDYIKL